MDVVFEIKNERSICDHEEGLGASVGLEGAVIQGWASTSSINGRLAMSLVNIHLVNPIESIKSMDNKVVSVSLNIATACRN